MKIALIIPTLNERGSLPRLFEELRPVLAELKAKNYELEILIIDDDSNDGTQAFVQEFILTQVLPIRLIERKERGLATAVMRGFKETSAELVCVMDADLSHPPKLIPTLVEKAKDFDMVVASRNIPGGGAEEWPIHRKLTSMLATSFVIFIGIKIKDPMSGFFLFKKSIIDNVELSPIGYKILLEILVKGKIKNITEVPYIFRNRAVGASKMSGRIIGQYLKHLWVLRKWQKK